MSIYKMTLNNGECGTTFCINWHDRLALATCDHVFLSLGQATIAALTFSDGNNSFVSGCELRRHPTADVALALPLEDFELPLSPLRILRATSEAVPDSTMVILEGFEPRAQALTTFRGFTRSQRPGTKTYAHPTAGLRTYSGIIIPNSLPGRPGMSGSPIRTVRENGVLAVYSCSGNSHLLTDGFHSGHLEEIP
jgi:hypothetical protein